MGRTEKLGPLLEKELERTEGDPPVIVRLKPNVATSSAVSALSATGLSVTGQNTKTNLVFGDALPEQIDRIQQLDSVEQVELDADVRALQGENPFTTSRILPALDASQASSKRSITEAKKQVNAQNLNDRGVTGSGVRVAVLDTGVNSNNPALQGQVFDEVQIAEGDLQDSVGHGTWVASAIAGNGAEVDGVTLEGVAPDAEIINVKVLNDSGTGKISNIIEGASRAGDAGADVVNLSLGAPAPCGEDSAICQAFKDISRIDNLTFVCAAGNQGPQTNPALPAGCNTSIAVGSVRKNGEPSGFSSRGPICDGDLYPGISAPGGSAQEGIIGAYRSGSRALKGTSMACPFVAGAACLMLEAERSLSTRRISNALFATGSRADQPNNSVGHGVMDVMAAVEQLQSPNPSPGDPGEEPSLTDPVSLGAIAGGALLLDAEVLETEILVSEIL